MHISPQLEFAFLAKGWKTPQTQYQAETDQKEYARHLTRRGIYNFLAYSSCIRFFTAGANRPGSTEARSGKRKAYISIACGEWVMHIFAYRASRPAGRILRCQLSKEEFERTPVSADRVYRQRAKLMLRRCIARARCSSTSEKKKRWKYNNNKLSNNIHTPWAVRRQGGSAIAI